MTKIFINDRTKNNATKIINLKKGDFFELLGLLYIKCTEKHIYNIREKLFIDLRNTFEINLYTPVIYVNEININYKTIFAN